MPIGVIINVCAVITGGLLGGAVGKFLSADFKMNLNMIFACTLGVVVSLIAVPQFLIFMLLFVLAKVILPLTTPVMINDFKAAGGVLLLATGFRMLKLRNFPVADMIPAMILIMPVSWFWVNYILPLVS